MTNFKGNAKVSLLVGAVAVLILGLVGFGAYSAGKGTGTELGVNLTYSSAQSRIETFNLLDDMIEDIYAVASSSGQGLYANASWNPLPISSSSPSATTTITVSGAAVGDFAIGSLATTTSGGLWSISARVSAADTVMLTLQAVVSTSTSGFYNNAAGLDLGSATAHARVLKASNVVLNSATTTAANR